MKSFNVDIYDQGLEQITNSANWSGGVLNLQMLKGPPKSFTDATNAPSDPTPGLRVSGQIALAEADLTLANTNDGGREISVGAKADAVMVNVPAITNGTATGASTNTLTDTTQSFTANALIDKVVKITGGTGDGQSAVILSNTATEITLASNWGTLPDVSSTYEVREDLHIAITDSTRMLIVTNETSDQVLTQGNPINLPGFSFGFGPPV